MRAFAIGLAAAALATSMPLSANAFDAVSGTEPRFQGAGYAYVDPAHYYDYGPPGYYGVPYGPYGGHFYYRPYGFYGEHFYYRPYGFYGKHFYYRPHGYYRPYGYYGSPYGRHFYGWDYGPW